MKKINLAIFISGNGSNAVNIINYFKDHPSINPSIVISNKHDNAGLKKMFDLKIPTVILHNDFFKDDTSQLQNLLQNNRIDYIILAGFLRKIPSSIINLFKDKIINIHPSLLPEYGGKNMYGKHVHKAVLENKESFSGISIHLVNNEYDKGTILTKRSCKISLNETVESLSKKIHNLEHNYFPLLLKANILFQTNEKTEKTLLEKLPFFSTTEKDIPLQTNEEVEEFSPFLKKPPTTLL